MRQFLENIVEPYPMLRQFIKFSLVGVGNTAIDFTVYFILTRVFDWWSEHYLLANVMAFFCASLFSFSMNRIWTFRVFGAGRLKQYIRFIAVNIIALILVQLTLYVVVDMFGVYDLFAKIVALMVSVVVNFTGSKFWAFR